MACVNSVDKKNWIHFCKHTLTIEIMRLTAIKTFDLHAENVTETSFQTWLHPCEGGCYKRTQLPNSRPAYGVSCRLKQNLKLAWWKSGAAEENKVLISLFLSAWGHLGLRQEHTHWAAHSWREVRCCPGVFTARTVAPDFRPQRLWRAETLTKSSFNCSQTTWC